MGSIEERNKQIVREFIEAFEAGNADRIRACFAPDAVVWTGGELWFSGSRDVDTMFDQAADLFQHFPSGLKFIKKAMIAEGNRVSWELEADDWPHVSGGVYHNVYHFLWVLSDEGKILEFKEYLDTAHAEKFLSERRPAALRTESNG